MLFPKGINKSEPFFTCLLMTSPPVLKPCYAPVPTPTASSAVRSHNCNTAPTAWSVCFSLLSTHNNSPQGVLFFHNCFVNTCCKYFHFTDADSEVYSLCLAQDLNWQQQNWEEKLSFQAQQHCHGFPAILFTLLRTGLLQAQSMTTVFKQHQPIPMYKRQTADRCFSSAMLPCRFISLIVHCRYGACLESLFNQIIKLHSCTSLVQLLQRLPLH